MINLIIWLVLGGVIGWLASIVMRTDAQQGTVLNVIVGIVGSFLAGLVFNRDGLNNSNFSLPSLLWAFLGAVVLLAIVNLVRRGRVR